MWPSCQKLFHRAVELLAVVESRTEHDLRVILDLCRFQAIEVSRNLCSPPRIEHGSAQIGIHRMDGNEQRREVVSFDAQKILFAHIRQRNKVAVKERHAIIVILDGQAFPHARRNLVDEAEAATIAARAYAVKDGGSELHAKFLIIVFVKSKQFLLAIRMFDKKLNLLLGEGKAQVNDVAQLLSIDGEDLVTDGKFQLLRQTSWHHAYDFP